MSEALKNIAKIAAGNSAPSKDDFSENGIPFIRASSLEFLVRGVPIDECEMVDPALAKEKKLRLFSKGSILFAKSGMSAKMGRVYVLPRDAYVVSHLAVITVTDVNTNNQYIAYYFNYRPPFNLIKDDAYPSINLSDIENVEVPLPDLETQNKIVSMLDKAKAILDKREETIAKYKELLRATFLEMFGDPFFNRSGFSTDRLENLCSFITKGTTPFNSKIFKSAFNGSIPFLKVYHIINDEIDFYHNPSYIDLKTHEELKRSKVFPNDVLMNIVGPPLGKIGIVPDSFEEWNINQAIVIFRTKDRILPSFLLNVLQSKTVLASIVRQAIGVRQLNISLKQCREIEIPVPPMELQVRFNDFYKTYKVLLSKLKIHLHNAEQFFLSLCQQVFSERIIIDVDAELEALINAIDLEKKDEDNKIDTVVNDITFVQHLMDKLRDHEFENKEQYDKASYILLRIMKEEEGLVKQIFKNDEIQITLLNETSQA